jgi:hypothetical protein
MVIITIIPLIGTLGTPHDDQATRQLQNAVQTQLAAFSAGGGGGGGSGEGRMSYREFMTMLAQPPWNLLLHDALERSIDCEREASAVQEAHLEGMAVLQTQREALQALWDELDKGTQVRLVA